MLIIDDSPFDAELSLMTLRRSGMLVDGAVAADEAELRALLPTFAPDVVLCDSSFPNFDGVAAQRIVREAYAVAPLLFVSGAISEERAAIALQSGAVDYVMKTNLVRLPSAVQRAVRTARMTAAAERRALAHAERLEALWGIANDPAFQGPELVVALLEQAAAVMSPPLHFRGLLYRIEHDDTAIVLDVGNPVGGDPSEGLHRLGARRASETSVVPGGRSRGWDDVAVGSTLPPELVALGWRAVICTQFESGGASYGLAFASSEPTATAFGDEDFAYLDVLASSVAHQLQVNELEGSLRDAEEHSRAHAVRLEALWRIVNDPMLGDADKWLAMLAQAAASIWPGLPSRGMLWRVHGTEMTLEAIADSPEPILGGVPVHVGWVIPLADSVAGLVLAEGGGIRSWEDVRASLSVTDVTRARGVRACVVTTFNAGGSTWALQFVSGRRAEEPLGQQEHAYIEVLASFFSIHVQQRWQFERIEYQQSHDVQTGLLNRSQFRSLASAQARESAGYAIVVIDVDAFHEVNESYGHTVGDALIVEVAGALQRCALRDEIVGRVGADVFAVYLPAPPSAEYILARARCFAEMFSRAFSVGERENPRIVARSASFGVGVSQETGQAIDVVLSHADAALAVAKERGHGFIVPYEAGMEGDAQLRADLRNEIAEAIEKDQFALYYQPHVEMSTGAVTGCEALIRWNHPVRGLVLPAEFIPFAEKVGIITSIDAWVMQHAFAAAADLCASRPDFRLYFNLSGRQAGDPKLVRAFIDAARSGVPMEHLGVEITESDAMRDIEATRRVSRALRRLNVRVAIDDFGTGYSSLSSLKRLPVDIVKIDRSFISGVTHNPHDAAIAETIISLAANFELDALAEGAEEPAEIEWLREHACRYVQGYAICHPLPMDAFQAWLNEANERGGIPTHLASHG
ncbi:MAG: GGDEF domain-containing response regulator [Vulcanimicrobiaceae bacterium]